MQSSGPLPDPQTPSNLAALSINQLARLYCRERLIVDPLEWTDRHLTLLQCSFENPTPGPSQISQDSTDATPDGNTGAGYVQRLFSRTNYAWRNFLMSAILTIRPECPFVAVQRCVKKLPCVGFYLGDRNAARQRRVPPVAAFIDGSLIPELRSRRISTGGHRRWSEPTNALYQLKKKKLTPSETLHDPYIVVLLIAIASERRYHSPEDEKQIKIMTFLIKKNVHLFTADIPSSFLEKLDSPAVPPPVSPPPSFSIRHTVLPRQPCKTFRKRLLRLLLPPPDDQDLNTGDNDVVQQPGEQQETKA
ncbi:hypothetical protein B7463_g2595, partial [Scytalidium lignicola]